jgi:hypothetical protein
LPVVEPVVEKKEEVLPTFFESPVKEERRVKKPEPEIEDSSYG